MTDERVLRCAKALGEAIGGTVSPARALIAWSLRQDGVVAVVVKSSDGERIGEFILFFMRAIRLTLLLFFLQPRTWVPRVSKLRRGWRR